MVKLDERVREVLFPENGYSKIDMAGLARGTGIPVSSLRRYRNDPCTMPLDRLCVLAQVEGISPEDMFYLLVGRRP